ncbi:MAG: Trm112 family protein [Gammaproteobacteria bacterium]
MLDKDILDLLVCIRCKNSLSQSLENKLDCLNCNISFPIIDDIPRLIEDEVVNNNV